MAGYEIRPMTEGDAEQVALLTAQLGYEVTVAQTRERIGRIAGDGVAFVAVAGEAIIGWVQALNRELLIYPRILEVGGLVVAETHRGSGVGKALLAELAAWGRDNGHGHIFVRSSVVRDGAHRFYEGQGFRREKTSHTFSVEIE